MKNRKKAYTDACIIAWQYGKALDKTQQEKENLCKKLQEKKENLEIIYSKIAELWDYVYDSDYVEKEHILQELENMQIYAG